MKTKLFTILGALLLATSLSSCYVYSDPLSWAYPRSSYGYGQRGYNSGHFGHGYHGNSHHNYGHHGSTHHGGGHHSSGHHGGRH